MKEYCAYCGRALLFWNESFFSLLALNSYKWSVLICTRFTLFCEYSEALIYIDVIIGFVEVYLADSGGELSFICDEVYYTACGKRSILPHTRFTLPCEYLQALVGIAAIMQLVEQYLVCSRRDLSSDWNGPFLPST